MVVDLGAEFATGEGNDTLLGFSGVVGSDYNDTLISGPFTPWPRPDGQASTGELLGFGGNDLIVIAPGTYPEAVAGGDGDDTIVGSQSMDCTQFFIRANRGDDTILTSRRGACINGGHGNDTIHGNSGVDRVYAGAGNDTIFGRRGPDWFRAGPGSDHLHGNRGSDRLQGSDGISGNDTVSGGRGTDSCQADPGDAVTRCES
jgi:Ca2+-binding RTX toxin-like protein